MVGLDDGVGMGGLERVGLDGWLESWVWNGLVGMVGLEKVGLEWWVVMGGLDWVVWWAGVIG